MAISVLNIDHSNLIQYFQRIMPCQNKEDITILASVIPQVLTVMPNIDLNFKHIDFPLVQFTANSFNLSQCLIWLKCSVDQETKGEIDKAIVQVYAWIKSYISLSSEVFKEPANRVIELVTDLFKNKVDKKKVAVALHTQILLQKKNLALDQESIRVWHERKKCICNKFSQADNKIIQYYICCLIGEKFLWEASQQRTENLINILQEKQNKILNQQQKFKEISSPQQVKQQTKSPKQKKEQQRRKIKIQHREEDQQAKSDRSCQLRQEELKKVRQNQEKARIEKIEKRRRRRITQIAKYIDQKYEKTRQNSGTKQLYKIAELIFEKQELFMDMAVRRILNLTKITHEKYGSEGLGDQFRFMSKKNKKLKQALFSKANQYKFIKAPSNYHFTKLHYRSKLESFTKMQRQEWKIQKKGIAIMKEEMKDYWPRNIYREMLDEQEKPEPFEAMEEIPNKTNRLNVTMSIARSYLMDNYDWIYATQKSLYQL